MQVFHGVRPSQPPRPRVMHEVSAREGSREAFTGETAGWVSSCETGRIPRCRSSSLTRRQHPPRANGLRMEEPRAVGPPQRKTVGLSPDDPVWDPTTFIPKRFLCLGFFFAATKWPLWPQWQPQSL